MYNLGLCDSSSGCRILLKAFLFRWRPQCQWHWIGVFIGTNWVTIYSLHWDKFRLYVQCPICAIDKNTPLSLPLYWLVASVTLKRSLLLFRVRDSRDKTKAVENERALINLYGSVPRMTVYGYDYNACSKVCVSNTHCNVLTVKLIQ